MRASIGLLSWINHDLDQLRAKLFRGVIAEVPAERWAERADGGGSTIAHLLLHLARHHDLAINTAIRNRPPLFTAHRDAIGLAAAAPWFAVPEAEQPAVTTALSMAAVADYVNATFLATAEWLDGIGTMVLDTVPDTSARLVRHAAIPTDELDWLHAMWADQPVWWLVQWPVLGHGFAHLGELLSIRNRLIGAAF
jgi:hypothetical protein